MENKNEILKGYDKLILNDSGEYEMAFKGSHKEFDFSTSKCEFCGHGISLGRSIFNIKDNVYMIVGSNCFSNLLGLSKMQENIIKKRDKICKNVIKYEKVINYLKKKYDAKPWYEARAIRDTRRRDLIRVEFELNEQDEVRFKFTDIDNGVSFISWRSRQGDYPACSIECPEDFDVDEIFRKIYTTTNINKHWFEKFQKEYNVNLLALLK